MAKPKRKPITLKQAGRMAEQALLRAELKRVVKPSKIDYTLPFSDTDRLDALLRHTSVIILVAEGDDTEIFGENRMLTTRRDIDKLLREEGRRAR